MVRYEVIEQLKKYKTRIFFAHSVKDFLKLNEEIDIYINSMNVSQEELAEFVNSGAGEMLEMVISGIEYAKLK